MSTTSTTAPHPAIRSAIVSAAVLVVVLVVLAGAAPAVAESSSQNAEERMLALVTGARAEAGLPTLSVNAHLTAVARDWTWQMQASGSDLPAHNPDAYTQAGCSGLGENVGRTILPGANEDELVERLHESFMASEVHRDNILHDGSTDVGLGISVDERGAMWVTQLFASGCQDEPAPPVAEQPETLSPAAPLTTVEEALHASRGLFTERRPAHVVLARADVFADSLAGAALTGGGQAPILFTPAPGSSDAGLPPSVRGEIDRLLDGRGRVYLLGGTRAVSSTVERELGRAGYQVVRLAGGDRVATARAIADEVVALYGAPQRVLIASAWDWPDAVSAGAAAAWARDPVLLTGADHLAEPTRAFLDRHQPGQRVVIGGSAVISEEVRAAAGARRLAGRTRVETAVAISEHLFGRTRAADGDAFVTVHGWHPMGWGAALGWSALSGRDGAPLLLVADDTPAAVHDYLDGLGYGTGRRGNATHASLTPSGARHGVDALLAD